MQIEGRKGATGMRIGQWVLVAALVVAAGIGGYVLRGTSSPASEAAGGSRAGTQGQFGQGGFQGQPGQGFGRAGVTITVQTDTSQTGTLVAQRQAAGTVQPVTQSQVAAKTTGVVSKILANVGDTVKAGQPVLQLEDSQLRIAVQNAQLALQNARINLTTQTNATADATLKLQQQLQAAQTALANAQISYQSAQRVYKLGGLSVNDLNSAKAALDTAQANVSAAQSALAANQRAGNESLAQLRVAIAQAQNQLQQAQINLESATIRAPFAGQISAINVAVGEAVGSSSQPFTLVSLERQVRFSVPPADAASISPGQTLTFNTGAQSFQVKVDQRPAAPVNQTVSLTARILGNTLPQAGTVGTLTYPVRLAQGTLVPIAALQNDGTRSYVFVVEGGKAKATTVTVLAQAGSQAAVSGLGPNLEIIVSPPPGLLDGSSVAKAGSQPSSQGGYGQGQGQNGSGQGQYRRGRQEQVSPSERQNSGGQSSSSPGNSAQPTQSGSGASQGNAAPQGQPSGSSNGQTPPRNPQNSAPQRGGQP